MTFFQSSLLFLVRPRDSRRPTHVFLLFIRMLLFLLVFFSRTLFSHLLLFPLLLSACFFSLNSSPAPCVWLKCKRVRAFRRSEFASGVLFTLAPQKRLYLCARTGGAINTHRRLDSRRNNIVFIIFPGLFRHRASTPTVRRHESYSVNNDILPRRSSRDNNTAGGGGESPVACTGGRTPDPQNGVGVVSAVRKFYPGKSVLTEPLQHFVFFTETFFYLISQSVSCVNVY